MPEKNPVDIRFVKMPFGKHKGEYVSDMPTSYCRWAVENMNDLREPLLSALEARAEDEEDDDGY